MSLIQEALEKAGRLPASPAPKFTRVPVEEKIFPVEKEVPVQKIPAVKTESLWLVGFKVKLLGLLDKVKIKPERENKSRKSGFIATGLIALFLGAVFYVHTVSLRPLTVTDAQTLPVEDPDSAVAQNDLSAAVLPNFELTGITFSGSTRLALINDQVVGVGEKLKENATVIEIQGQKVALDYQGKRIDLEL